MYLILDDVCERPLMWFSAHLSFLYNDGFVIDENLSRFSVFINVLLE